MRKPLPPGEYTLKIERVRKVRNKPYYRIHYVLQDGTRMSTVVAL